MLITIVGLYVMSDFIEIRQKTPVNIVTDGNRVRVYMQKGGIHANKGNHIDIEQTSVGTMHIVVDEIKEEPAYTVLHARSADVFPLKGNSYSQGFIFTGSIKLKDLIIDKIGIHNP